MLAGEGISFAAPAPGAVDAFKAAVRARGLSVTVRQEKGQDISGACGQLVIDAAAQRRLEEGLAGGASGGGGGGGGGGCGGGGGGGGGVRDIEELVAAR